VTHRSRRFFHTIAAVLFCLASLASWLQAGPAVAQEEPGGGDPGETPTLAESGDTRPKRPLSLREAIETALANNLAVAIRKKDTESARYGVTQEQGAFDPLLGASGDYAESKQEAQSAFQISSSESAQLGVSVQQRLHPGTEYSVGFSANRFVGSSLISPVPTSYDSGLSLSVTQPLLRDFGEEVNTAGIEIAKLDVDSSDEAFRGTLIETLSDVTKAYWDLQSAIYALRVQRESLKLAQDLLSLNRKKVEVGTLAPIQITEAEASVASREQGVIIAEADIKNSEDNLRRIMNVPPDSPDWDMGIEPTDLPPFEDLDVDEEALIRAALEGRPELREARNFVRASELRSRVARNQKKPQLDAIAAYGPSGNNFTVESESVVVQQYVDADPQSGFPLDDLNGDGQITYPEDTVPVRITDSTLKISGLGESVSEVFRNDNYTWRVGLMFSLPIGNRSAKAAEARSRIAYEQSELALQDLERNVRVEVRRAILAVTTFRKSVDAARVNVTLQRKKLEAEQKRYDNGMSTSFQVLTFQNDLTAALNQQIVAVTAYIKSVVELGRVTTTLPEKSGVTLVTP